MCAVNKQFVYVDLQYDEISLTFTTGSGPCVVSVCEVVVVPYVDAVVEVSVYCAWRIPAHLRYTQCSMMLHLMDISFLQCICLWNILQIQTCLCVVLGPGFVLTLPTFMRNSANHPVGVHSQLAPKNGKSGHLLLG